MYEYLFDIQGGTKVTMSTGTYLEFTKRVVTCAPDYMHKI